MHFYTQQQCEEWLAQRTRVRPDQDRSLPAERFEYPNEAFRAFPIARAIAHGITHRQPALLWITEWGIWPSSENWHLYYKLRQSYGDFQLLHDAPGHLFLGYESEDLGTFLQLAMLSGWGGFLLTDANHVNASFSHDGYLDFYTQTPENLAELKPFFAESPSARGS
jgi:hypothetical protein